jgi:hypothetical protein
MSNKSGKFDPCITGSLLMALTFDQQKQIDKIKDKRYLSFSNHNIIVNGLDLLK